MVLYLSSVSGIMLDSLACRDTIVSAVAAEMSGLSDVPPHEVASKEIAIIEIIFFIVEAPQMDCLIVVIFNCLQVRINGKGHS